MGFDRLARCTRSQRDTHEGGGGTLRGQARDKRDARWRATGIPQALLLTQALLVAGTNLGMASLARRMGSPARADAAQMRAVEHAVTVLGRLKGPWAKLGQFASLRRDLLPSRATRALARLRTDASPLPFPRIRAAVEAELGTPLDRAFSRFDAVPLGAASIAQAHGACLSDGREVVVKVQYPWLEAALPADLRLLGFGLKVWARLTVASPRTDLLFEEFSRGLREELDFEREARVAAEIGACLADDESVLVPEVVTTHSTKRVLTVVRHPAIGLTHTAALEARGVELAAVVRILARAYTTQMFRAGLFHADPHPGNLFVVDEPEIASRPRLLFVDFGLSRRLAPELLHELRSGMLALIQGEHDVFLDGMERLGAIAPGGREGVAAAVKHMFARIQSEGGPLALGGDSVLSLKDEAVALLQETPGLQLPADLLLYAKTLAYVFSLGRELAPEVDMMRLCLPPLLRFLAVPATPPKG